MKDSITVLFERCLIPCAYYEEFWVKYINWAVGSREDWLRV